MTEGGVLSVRQYVGRPLKDCAEVDESVVERLLNGSSVVASWWELDAAIMRLLGLGVSHRDAARRLGISDRTVTRHNVRRRAIPGAV